ncbi:mycothiol transferase [Kribbella solani]|uniref:mycothiol transferase n=1 Tax=Kribbella solani TaxID=236067 RepID=UPI0029B9D2EF|nr:DUF664 domain-containing protein [Kribbella solani]MDX2970844.1 DUF664 domain-containing protein [Kribbella solani]
MADHVARGGLERVRRRKEGPVRVERLLLDVLQESARHLGQLDVLRELIDGGRGE